MAHICKTPACGNDLTMTVLRLQLSGVGMNIRTVTTTEQQLGDPVIVTCPKCGVAHEYP